MCLFNCHPNSRAPPALAPSFYLKNAPLLECMHVCCQSMCLSLCARLPNKTTQRCCDGSCTMEKASFCLNRKSDLQMTTFSIGSTIFQSLSNSIIQMFRRKNGVLCFINDRQSCSYGPPVYCPVYSINPKNTINPTAHACTLSRRQLIYKTYRPLCIFESPAQQIIIECCTLCYFGDVRQYRIESGKRHTSHSYTAVSIHDIFYTERVIRNMCPIYILFIHVLDIILY